ncbi:MAG: methylmalonyl-CoA mutase [Chloroflexi bacterium]|nr:methylmalonyl-CoA mutase [Chloroflexota bacterium]
MRGRQRATKKLVKAVIGGKEHEVPEAKTCSGVDIKPVYGPEDVAGLSYQRDLGDPGQFPFTRGIHPTMYRTQLWAFRQYSGFGTPEETNQRYKYLMKHGQTGLSVALDLPTQMGLDSDDPRAEGEVGRNGVAIATLDDMERLFDGIDLGQASTSITINAVTNPLVAMYLVAAEKQGVPWTNVRGTVQNDTLKEYVSRGTWIFPVEPAVKLIGDTIEFTTQKVPKYNPISLAGCHIRSAGGDDAFSLAVSFKNGEAYINEVLKRGLAIDQFAGRFSFILSGDMEFFETVCKLRAARRIWARLLKDKYGAKDPRTMMMRFAGGSTGGYFLTRSMPEMNIARIAISGLASFLGGTQSAALPSYDEAYALPTERSAKMTLMVQAIIAYETGVADVVDPLAGSYFVEALTNEIEKKILAYMDQIDKWGGPVEAVKNGSIAREIARQSYERERKLQTGEIPMVGVNVFAEEAEGETHEMEVFEIDPKVQDRQVARLREVKAQRSTEEAQRTLNALKRAAEKNQENLLPYFIDATRAYVTLGEMTKALKDVYGEFREPVLN